MKEKNINLLLKELKDQVIKLKEQEAEKTSEENLYNCFKELDNIINEYLNINQ
jgi:hypothetical protein